MGGWRTISYYFTFQQFTSLPKAAGNQIERTKITGGGEVGGDKSRWPGKLGELYYGPSSKG
jgi:hypothetical protein